MKSTVAVPGAGARSTAGAKGIAEKGSDVVGRSYEPETVRGINANHANERFLPGAAPPEALMDSEEAAVNRKYLIPAVPFVRGCGAERDTGFGHGAAKCVKIRSGQYNLKTPVFTGFYRIPHREVKPVGYTRRVCTLKQIPCQNSHTPPFRTGRVIFLYRFQTEMAREKPCI